MLCYLIRHGKDDDTVRGGWSDAPLTEQGIAQASELASKISTDPHMNLVRIFSSDLVRASQTAEILSQKIQVPVEYCPEFREADNGELAGMKHTEALEKYPGLFWNTLNWDEHYPDGESPHEFFERVSNAWREFARDVQEFDGNVALVTHGGVINVILHLINGLEYSNRTKPYPVKYAEVIEVQI